MWNNFRQDPVNDEYKVLSIVWSEWGRLETKVLVLGARAPWRNTRRSRTPPLSYTQGISINGVLYYGARCDGKRCVVMSFDWTCEEFNMIELPVEARIIRRLNGRANLMNYNGKVAAFNCSRLNTESILDLWVLEDAGNSKWWLKVFVLPCHQLSQLIRGSNRSGKVRLSGQKLGNNKVPKHAIYDLERKRIRQGVVMEQLNQVLLYRHCAGHSLG